ncbi:MAG: HlyD family secretion protein [Verrucomicrobiota bacterium]
MSEFHPNRKKMVRTKPGLTRRRIIEMWPLLVWAAVLYAGWHMYRGGVVFARMNGAVDVYQENITPSEDGRLLDIKVQRGQKVEPGTVVAVMDPAPYKMELEGLRREVLADRVKDIREYDQEILKLESELREIDVAAAEDGATMKQLEAFVNDYDVRMKASSDPVFRRLADQTAEEKRLELAQARARTTVNVANRAQVEDSVNRAKGVREQLQKEADVVAKANLESDDLLKTGALREDEQQRFIELTTMIGLCELKTTKGGIIDRVVKEKGEYVKAGDGVLKVVGEPEHIVCFLPQDQSDDLKVGQKVWVVATSDKTKIFESTVEGISPRINNLPDSSSPIPNRRVHGRDVIIHYPPLALPTATDSAYKLLSGQTVIIHTSKPGQVPLLDRIFPNDDNEKTL